ncbi:MAG: hypothetical protein CSA40_01035 [Flavobacteriales bacterium]|nr:MAG: hypothetical protein CSA40_01035 [Flavobacteriales bacterium]
MKKTIFFSLLVLMLSFTACQSTDKKTSKTDDVTYSVKDAKHTLQWTAYKTTAKTPVKGTFKTINVIKGGQGQSVKEAVNGVDFEIPVNTIFSKDSIRDSKLKEFFFGKMVNTALLSGKIVLETDDKGYIDLMMNNTKQRLPFTYKIEGKTFSLEGKMELKDWQALDALGKLHEVCFDLHKGVDGVSKTWEEVAVSLKSEF